MSLSRWAQSAKDNTAASLVAAAPRAKLPAMLPMNRAHVWMKAAAIGFSLAFILGCPGDKATPPEEKTPSPSLLLVVIDTLRADAVSAYGEVRNTTPNLDALAAKGQRYTRAYAPSPWTVPSHASLLSGLEVPAHGVGLGGRVLLPQAVDTLAERLRAAGYQTAGFSENALVSGDFGFDQGFDHFAVRTAQQQLAAGQKAAIDVEAEMRLWLDQRDPERPFFIFVNLYDPHEPYAVREENRFLPPGITTEDAKRLGAGGRTSHLICDRIPSEAELGILQGLYLGDVAAADAKLGAVLALLKSRGIENLVTVVTSDHGEHFGERRLLDHEFSVQEEVLRVPLVVSRPGTRPAAVDQPVELRDVARSLLEWAGASTSPITARGLENSARSADAGSPPPLVALYSDTRLHLPAALDPGTAQDVQDFKRGGCGDGDRVYGDMLALTRFPFRLNWYARYPSEFLDLRQPGAGTEAATSQSPEAFAALERQANRFAEHVGLGQATGAQPLPAKNEDALRSLGYID